MIRLEGLTISRLPYNILLFNSGSATPFSGLKTNQMLLYFSFNLNTT